MFQGFVSFDHKIFESEEIISEEKLVEQFFLFGLKSFFNNLSKLLLAHSNLFHHSINKSTNKFFEFLDNKFKYIMNNSILKLVFFLVVKNDAFIVNKVEKTYPPKGTTQELNHEIIHPFLTKRKNYIFSFLFFLWLFRFGLRLLFFSAEKPIKHFFLMIT